MPNAFTSSKKDVVMKHRLSVASLSFQVVLHYNTIYACFFTIIAMAVAINKYTSFNYSIDIAVLCPWIVIEAIRLYYGYSGNLREKVPDLSTFLLITVFPQFPIIIYLSYAQNLLYPANKILGSFMIIFQATEFVFGVLTIRRQIRNQTSQFMRIVAED